MKKGSLNFFELHVEKIVLGAAGLFTLAFLWMYLINSPNKVEYNGEAVGPGDLDEKVLEHAKGLQRAVQSATAEAPKKPEYASLLREQHTAGIFGKAPAGEGPALTAALPSASAFGAPIVIPGQKEEQATNIVVVTPLKPGPPVGRTGRSMAVRKEIDLAAAPTPGAAPEGRSSPDTPAGEAVDAAETPWVTVGAWFDTQAQQTEMTNARYEPYLARVLFAGVDVERQEQNADGGWADWTAVKNSKAVPKLSVPAPIFDQDTGAMVNKDEVEAAYKIVIAQQEALAQPKFYEVAAGDHWLEPPLEGLELDEDTEEMDDAEPEPRQKEEREDRPPPVARPPVTPPGGGRTGGGVFNPGGGRGAGGRGIPQPSGGNDAAKEKRLNAAAADKAFRDARKAYSTRDYERARQLAGEAANNPDAKKKTKADAEKLVAKVQKRLEEAAASGSGGGRVIGPIGNRGGPVSPSDPRGGGGAVGAAPAPTVALVTHPEKEHEVALWFHDDSVESGKTYRYRLRARLWNRYVGQMKAVKSVDDAKKPVLEGEWSAPSAAITVSPSTHLFVKGPKGNKQAASVDVWKWRAGNWIRESFDVAVGDSIGGVKRIKTGETDENEKEIREDVDFSTGAIVLDLRFDERVKVRAAAGKKGEFTYREVTSLVLVYLDPADGQIKERVQALDRDDPTKKKLERESEGDA